MNNNREPEKAMNADERYEPTADDWAEYMAWLESIETDVTDQLPPDEWKDVNDRLNDEYQEWLEDEQAEYPTPTLPNAA
jgi:hypothetical protein